jgi:hypothetical protein
MKPSQGKPGHHGAVILPRSTLIELSIQTKKTKGISETTNGKSKPRTADRCRPVFFLAVCLEISIKDYS